MYSEDWRKSQRIKESPQIKKNGKESWKIYLTMLNIYISMRPRMRIFTGQEFLRHCHYWYLIFCTKENKMILISISCIQTDD